MGTTFTLNVYSNNDFIGNLYSQYDGDYFINEVIKFLDSRTIVNGLSLESENQINGIEDFLPLFIHYIKNGKPGCYYLVSEKEEGQYSYKLNYNSDFSSYSLEIIDTKSNNIVYSIDDKLD